MLTRWQAQKDEFVLALASVRSALHDIRVETQRTLVRHEQMAAWYAERGDADAAWMEDRTAATQRQLLTDLDAAFRILEGAVSALIDLDP